MAGNSDLARQRWTSLALLGMLLALLTFHVVGVCLDFAAAIRYPFELGDGEGIVWQQAALIPGPRMYSTSQELPFIVFHYPPLYHLLAGAARSIEPDFLAAGRLVSALATVLIAPTVAGLVLIAAQRDDRPVGGVEVAIALAAGLLVLCLHAVRSWGPMMRVDMLAIMLSTMGLLVGAWSSGRFWGTTAALLLCVAALFTKQTQLPAGVAVFLIALLRNPRGAMGAAAVAGAVGLGAVGLMEMLTRNGFLLNIIGYNINSFSFERVARILWRERSSFPFMVLMLVAFVVLGRALLPSAARLRRRAGAAETWVLRKADRATACQALLLLKFALAAIMLPLTGKSGSNYNYLLDWLTTGCALIGVLLVHLARDGAGRGRWFEGATFLLVVGVAALPWREGSPRMSEEEAARRAALVERIAAAQNPVASVDETLLMRAGKPVVFECAIVRELVRVGRWDDTPLVEMIRAHGFAFMITWNQSGCTPATDVAMREAYPRVEQVASDLWVHLPPG